PGCIFRSGIMNRGTVERSSYPTEAIIMPKLHFQGLAFTPETSEPITFYELKLPQKEQGALFEQFRLALQRGSFEIELKVSGDDRPLTIYYSPTGSTSGWALYVYKGDSDKPEHVHGLTTFLARLDAAEDAEAMQYVRRF